MKKLLIMTLLLSTYSSFAQGLLGGASLLSGGYLEQFTTANLGQSRVSLGYRTSQEERRSRLLGLDDDPNVNFTTISQSGLNASFEHGFNFAALGVTYETYSGTTRLNRTDHDSKTSFATLFIQKKFTQFFYRLAYTLKLNEGTVNFEDNEVVISPRSFVDLKLGYAFGPSWGIMLGYTPSRLQETEVTNAFGVESDREAVVSSVASLKFFKEYPLSSTFIVGVEAGINSRYTSTSTVTYGLYSAIKFSTLDLVYHFDGETEMQDPEFAGTRTLGSHDISLRYNF